MAENQFSKFGQFRLSGLFVEAGYAEQFDPAMERFNHVLPNPEDLGSQSGIGKWVLSGADCVRGFREPRNAQRKRLVPRKKKSLIGYRRCCRRRRFESGG
jgi:hypothetical protein